MNGKMRLFSMSKFYRGKIFVGLGAVFILALFLRQSLLHCMQELILKVSNSSPQKKISLYLHMIGFLEK